MAETAGVEIEARVRGSERGLIGLVDVADPSDIRWNEWDHVLRHVEILDDERVPCIVLRSLLHEVRIQLRHQYDLNNYVSLFVRLKLIGVELLRQQAVQLTFPPTTASAERASCIRRPK